MASVPQRMERQKQDLVIVTDATGSMGSFLLSIQESVPEVLSLMTLTGCFDRLRILEYQDYCDPWVTKSSPWGASAKELLPFVESLEVGGGGDWPEAAKSAAAELLEWTTEEGAGARGLTVVWYADAPPHHDNQGGSNWKKEKKALGKDKSDWVWLCRALSAAGVRVYPVIDKESPDTAQFFVLLAEITGGLCTYLEYPNKESITRVTLNLLLGLMGCNHSLDAFRLTFSEKDDTCIPVDLVSESQALGFLPHSTGGSGKRICKVQTAAVEPVPSLQTDILRLGQRFNTDETFQETVFRVFSEELLLPHRILALTTNSVFGALWRAICRKRDDARSSECQSLLQAALLESDAHTQQEVRKWLQESYDRTEELRMALKDHKGDKYPALILDRPMGSETMNPPPSPQEMLELARSCHPLVLRRAGELLACLRVVQSPERSGDGVQKEEQIVVDGNEDELPVTELPLSLQDNDLFAFLPHLLAPGAIFSKRPALVLASVAILSGSALLKGRALKFLAHNKGKWFNREHTENYSRDLARLMLRVHSIAVSEGSEVLTGEERSFFQLVCTVAGLSINGATELILRQAPTPLKTPRPDIKRPCKQCGELRSFTLLTPGDVCGLCRKGTSAVGFPGPNSVPQCNGGKPWIGDWASPEKGPAVKDPLGESMSYWNECGVCRGHYAIVRKENMHRETPKCYYCVQKKDKAPLRHCRVCRNKFVDPCLAEGEEEGTGDWVCPPCQADAEGCLEDVTVDLKTLVGQNEDALLHKVLGVGVSEGQSVFGDISLFKTISSGLITAADGEKVGEGVPLGLMHLGKSVKNEEDVVRCILKWVNSGKAERDECMLCFERLRKDQVVRACGRRLCEAKACVACLGTWYGEAKPGHVLVLSTLQCPFCKQTPSVKVLQRFNRQVCNLMGRNEAEFLADPRWHYAWCIGCYRAQQWMERACDPDRQAALPTEFRCEVCEVEDMDKTLMQGSKPCPKCKFDVVKVSGCDHITCTCGEHWCWQCGKGGFDGYSIYGHIGSEHGGVLALEEYEG